MNIPSKFDNKVDGQYRVKEQRMWWKEASKFDVASSGAHHVNIESELEWTSTNFDTRWIIALCQLILQRPTLCCLLLEDFEQLIGQ